MIKNIGIRGHRGAGKNTISFLLGTAIDYYCEHGTFEGFTPVYNDAVQNIKNDEDVLEIVDFNNVLLESFADTPKIMLAELLGVDSSLMYDDYAKDHVFINIKDFSTMQFKDKLDCAAWVNSHRVYTSRELLDKMQIEFTVDAPHVILEDIWMTLREAISYFSYSMKALFGGNVWIKTLVKSQWEKDRFFSRDKMMYKIYTDVKFSSEISYILNENGIIVKVTRNEFKKKGTDISSALDNDERFDYEINIAEDISSMQKDIESLTLKIIGK